MLNAPLVVAKQNQRTLGGVGCGDDGGMMRMVGGGGSGGCGGDDDIWWIGGRVWRGMVMWQR
ncbi:hypothetical protein Tco_0476443, partial [Tanacetum coccineum]